LLPPHADTYGFAVVEFASAGCAVISTNIRASETYFFCFGEMLLKNLNAQQVFVPRWFVPPKCDTP
jgi:hypothetical protein